MAKKTSVRIPLLIGSLVLGVLFVGQSVAGIPGLPLRAELDLAQTVVVGKITNIVKQKEVNGGALVWGRASVAVSVVLKGEKANEVKATVAMQIDPNFGSAMASTPRVYRVGDEGIWVIMAEGIVSHEYGLFDKKQLDEVKATLADLDKRAWSEEVAGLKVWAGAAKHDWHPRNPQQVVFAVKNVSKSTIWLPRSSYEGVVTAIVRDSAGKEFELRGLGDRHPPDGRAVCRPLEPGRTRYMHPDSEDYGFIVVPRDMLPGKYTVTVSLANTHDGQTPGESKPVNAWQGKVTATPFLLEIPSPPASQPAGK